MDVSGGAVGDRHLSQRSEWSHFVGAWIFGRRVCRQMAPYLFVLFGSGPQAAE